MCKRLMFAFLVVAGLALVGGTAHADQIYVCQSCTAAPGGDPNIITNTGGFDVGVDGSGTLQDPLLIIVGVYDGTSATTAPTISCPSSDTCGAAPVGTYGLSADQTTMTSGTAFAALGLSAGGSESFGNWACGKNGCPGTGGDIGLGLAMPTSFELFAYQITGVNLTSTPISIDVDGAPNGSYVVGYGCEDETGSSDGCATEGDVARSVYTNTGLIDASVPEPGTLSMLALGLGVVGLLGFWRRREVNFAN